MFSVFTDPFSLLICLQIFEGNGNYDTPELRIVEPLLTRFIRIYPERATPAGMGLRMELLGCEIEGIGCFHILRSTSEFIEVVKYYFTMKADDTRDKAGGQKKDPHSQL